MDLSAELQAQVQQAAERREGLVIRGGGSKAFYGRPCQGRPLEVGGHRGIVLYEPTELVITARAGTPLAEVEAALAAERQLLPFEPPHFGGGATLGGAIATALSGPRRFQAGAARDFVLGVRCIDGEGRLLRFGGEVMKNVAGYDLSRLMTGALGTLGVLTELSLKVLPAPEEERTLVLELPFQEVAALLDDWTARALPVSAAAYADGRLLVRLSGGGRALSSAAAAIGGEAVEGESFWRDLRDHRLPFFASPLPLWRITLPPHAAEPEWPGQVLYDWGGRLLWLLSEAPAQEIRAQASAAGGQAVAFRHAPVDEVFPPLDAVGQRLHRRLKQAFDPHGILNRGRMY